MYKKTQQMIKKVRNLVEIFEAFQEPLACDSSRTGLHKIIRMRKSLASKIIHASICSVDTQEQAKAAVSDISSTKGRNMRYQQNVAIQPSLQALPMSKLIGSLKRSHTLCKHTNKTNCSQTHLNLHFFTNKGVDTYALKL